MRSETLSFVLISIFTLVQYSSAQTMVQVPIATYEEVKDLPNHPETLLIDVREPAEIAETGSIPTSINIPCKFDLQQLSLAFRIANLSSRKWVKCVAPSLTNYPTESSSCCLKSRSPSWMTL